MLTSIRHTMRMQRQRPTHGWSTVRRLLPYFFCHKYCVVSLLLCSLIDVAATLVGPYLIGQTIDNCFSISSKHFIQVDFRLMSHYIIVLAVVYIVSALSVWWREYGQTWLSQRIVLKMRVQLMHRLLFYPTSFFDKQSRGDLMSRFTNDAELVSRGLGQSLIQIISMSFMLLGMVMVMFLLSWRLMLLMFCSIPFVLFLSRYVLEKTSRFFKDQQKAVGHMNSVVEESLNAIRLTRNLDREDERCAEFEKVNLDLQHAGIRAQVYSGLLMPLLRVLDNATYIIVAVAGGWLAVGGLVSIGVIQTFLLYSRHFLRPINMLATQVNVVQSAIAGAERIFVMMDQSMEVDRIPDSETMSFPEDSMQLGKIEFRHVYFSYVPGVPVLTDLSFEIKSNEFVALVGQTGEGKSTVVNLLLRFYHPQQGIILIDDQDINEIPLFQLRRKIGLVLQEAVLFSDTVKYNIKYAEPKATDDKIQSTAVLSNANIVVSHLPYGYDTFLFGQGKNISQGERQLLTIARAVLPQSPILIFDEATSNIDINSERLVRQALNRLCHQRTCLVIAHRLDTLREADRILVLCNGHIVEAGSHDKLISEKGLYSSLYSRLS